jgi:hypothetical protein
MPDDTIEAVWLGGPEDGKSMVLPADTDWITIAEMVSPLSFTADTPEYPYTSVDMNYYDVPVRLMRRPTNPDLSEGREVWVLDFNARRKH